MYSKNVAAARGECGQRGFRLPGCERSERRIDGGLPLFLGDDLRRVLGRNDADVMLGQRHIDQRAAPRAVDPAQDKLRQRGPMAGRARQALRDQPAPHWRQRTQHRRKNGDQQLSDIDAVSGKLGEQQQRERRRESEDAGAEQKLCVAGGGGAGEHTHERSPGLELRSVERGLDARCRVGVEGHHQPPEAPPPPEDPPPPEKPPPPKPPPPPPKPPPPPRSPPPPNPPVPIGMKMTLPPPRLLMRLITNMIKRKMRKGARVSSREASCSARMSVGFGFHSAESVVSAVMMSSTPRVTPPLKSPALNLGAIALDMMMLETASVSVPSRP